MSFPSSQLPRFWNRMRPSSAKEIPRLAPSIFSSMTTGPDRNAPASVASMTLSPRTGTRPSHARCGVEGNL